MTHHMLLGLQVVLRVRQAHQKQVITLILSLLIKLVAILHTTICSRFYRFTYGIELTKALSENFQNIHILLAQTRQEIIHIHLPLVVLTNLTEVFPAVVMVIAHIPIRPIQQVPISILLL